MLNVDEIENHPSWRRVRLEPTSIEEAFLKSSRWEVETKQSYC